MIKNLTFSTNIKILSHFPILFNFWFYMSLKFKSFTPYNKMNIILKHLNKKIIKLIHGK